jgi:hypothetical protein
MRAQRRIPCARRFNGRLMRQRMKKHVLNCSSAITAALFLFTCGLRADVVIDNFTAPREYLPCCEAFSAYDSFLGNIVQSTTNGTISIIGDATDFGGFFQEGYGQVLWDLSGQTNLTLQIRALPGNEAQGLQIVLCDSSKRLRLYNFSLCSLTNTNFTALSASLAEPFWANDTNFNFGAITSLDVMGDYSGEDRPLRLELNGIGAAGPNNPRQSISYQVASGNFILTWPTNYTYGFYLQSALSVLGPWYDVVETPELIDDLYVLVYPIGAETCRFFRLCDTSNPGGEDLMQGFNSLVSNAATSTTGQNDVEPQVLPPFFLYTNTFDYPEPPSPWQTGARSANMQLNAMDNELPAPSTNPPPVYNYESFIDVGSYVGRSYYSWFESNVSNAFEFAVAESLDFNDHNTSTNYFIERDWWGHIPSPSAPYPWIRVSTNWWEYRISTAWDRRSTNWPNGWRYDSSLTIDYTNSYDPSLVGRPNMLYANIGYLGFTNTIGNTNYGGEGQSVCNWRYDATRLDLHVGTQVSNLWYRWVLLKATASAITSAGDWDGVYFEGDNSLATPYGYDLSYSNITLLGQNLNADNEVFMQFRPSSNLCINPTVAVSNFSFNVTIVPHKVVSLTRTYHPLFEKAPTTNPIPSLHYLQCQFNIASDALALDNDIRISENDQRVAISNDPSSLYRSDDAPTYIEFRISNGALRTNQYSPRRCSPTFPTNFTRHVFYDITDDSLVELLMDHPFANIKIVLGIKYHCHPVKSR